VDVAAPGRATAGDNDGVAVPREIAEQVIRRGVEDGCADRYPDRQVGTVPTFLPAAGAVLAVGRRKLGSLYEGRKIMEVAGGCQDDVAPGAAVATVGSTLRLEGLSSKRGRAAAAPARPDTEGDGVSEHLMP
jgi:hypothetical protein